MTLALERASDEDLRRLYARYLRERCAPFFIDVSGPPPRMKLERFVNYCTENDSAMRLCVREGKIAGCAHFRDKQPGLELANFDTIFFESYPAPESAEAREFGAAFRAACAEQQLSRVQLLALRNERGKIAFLEALGFRKEGLLREHYYFCNQTHDLVMLGWTSQDRSARLAALAEAEAEEDEDEDEEKEERAEAQPAARIAALPRAKPVATAENAGVQSRRVDAGDAELLVRWYGHPLIQETVEDEELSPEGLRAKAAMLAALDELRDGACAFIVEFDGEPAGLAHFMWFDWVSRTVEMDFFLAPDVRPGPFMARAVVREFGRIAFDDFHMNKLYGFTYANNEKSLGLNANLMETEAVLKDYLPKKGGGVDVHVQALLAADFFENSRCG